MLMISGIEMDKALMTLKQQGKKVYSNVYARLEAQRSYNAVITKNSIVFTEEDHGVTRAFFYSNDYKDLKTVFNDIAIPLTLDIITKNESEYQTVIQDMGFTLLARMRRLVNRDITDIVTKINDFGIRGGYCPNRD